jgi:hypothetical protein
MGKKMRLKEKENLKKKRLQELAEDDYVEPEHGADYSDSAILGVDPRHSEAESREEGHPRTLAEDEQEEAEYRRDLFITKSDAELHQTAEQLGMPDHQQLNRESLIQRLCQA